jgi:hypothetical protein
MSGMNYSERLAKLHLESLESRRLKYDLTMCYKISHDEVAINASDFFVFSHYTGTRGHLYKLYKCHSSVNAHKYCFVNRICDMWNSLPSRVVEAQTVHSFSHLLDSVELVKYCLN